MSILVQNGGFSVTVQDAGRFGYQKFGVSVAGYMDSMSAAIANAIVGNRGGEALLECMMMGPTLEFEEDIGFTITGADMSPKLNNLDICAYKLIKAKRGDVLSFGNLKNGVFAYIAFEGGLDVPRVMGSASTHVYSKIGGIEGRPIKKGDRLKLLANTKLPKDSQNDSLEFGLNLKPIWGEEIILRVVPDRFEERFTEKGLGNFYNESYTLQAASNRMGYRLEGIQIEHKKGADIITDGVIFGSVQVPSSGKPIIMMADRQTTGGYTRIANVISCDLSRLAQARAGSKIKFQRVEIEEAERIYKEYCENLKVICTEIEKRKRYGK